MPVIGQSPPTAALNRLLAIHYRSLPMYLHCAWPWTRPADEGSRDQQIAETLRHVVADQQRFVERISDALLDEGADIDPGAFPMEYTDLHDLSIEFLGKQLIDRQRRDIASIASCVRELADDPYLKSLAEEALGAAKGHLDSLVEAGR
jgi:hypothetical protein